MRPMTTVTTTTMIIGKRTKFNHSVNHSDFQKENDLDVQLTAPTKRLSGFVANRKRTCRRTRADAHVQTQTRERKSKQENANKQTQILKRKHANANT